MVKELLYQKYLLDHFGTFQTDTKVEMPTVLDYEIEYILKGKTQIMIILKHWHQTCWFIEC